MRWRHHPSCALNSMRHGRKEGELWSRIEKIFWIWEERRAFYTSVISYVNKTRSSCMCSSSSRTGLLAERGIFDFARDFRLRPICVCEAGQNYMYNQTARINILLDCNTLLC